MASSGCTRPAPTPWGRHRCGQRRPAAVTSINDGSPSGHQDCETRLSSSGIVARCGSPHRYEIFRQRQFRPQVQQTEEGDIATPARPVSAPRARPAAPISCPRDLAARFVSAGPCHEDLGLALCRQSGQRRRTPDPRLSGQSGSGEREIRRPGRACHGGRDSGTRLVAHAEQLGERIIIAFCF